MRRAGLVLALVVLLDVVVLDTGLPLLLATKTVFLFLRELRVFSAKALSGTNLYLGAALALLLALALYAAVLGVMRIRRQRREERSAAIVKTYP